jgi:hypothetical protein
MVEAEGVPPPMMKPRHGPQLENDPIVGIRIEGMGTITLGILMDGKKYMANVPYIEEPIENGIDGVGPMVLIEGNVEISGMTRVPLQDGIDSSTTLDETLCLDMV